MTPFRAAQRTSGSRHARPFESLGICQPAKLATRQKAIVYICHSKYLGEISSALTALYSERKTLSNEDLAEVLPRPVGSYGRSESHPRAQSSVQ